MSSFVRFACLILVCIGVSIAAVAVAAPTSDPAPADLVLRGGSVYTLDAVRSWAQAVAVRDGSIVYVGSSDGAGRFVGPKTKVVELGGRMVLPAFQDVHIHPIDGGLQALSCDLTALENREQYLQAVAKYAANHPQEEWILGGGWSMDAFPSAIPDGRLLDKIVPGRPVMLISADGHTAWVNSRALEIAGITRDTPDPEDGRIDRDPETGEPVGSLQEGAMDLVARHAPKPSLEKRVEGLRYALEMLNGYGITSIQEAIAEMDALETY
ncbi:MAG: amidohydrolase family protein, partial [Acidobacteriota bacterium]